MSEKNSSCRSLLIYLVAGEPSGDNLGGPIMHALKNIAAKNSIDIRFDGVGGERMTEAGMKSLFPLSDITLFGILEVIPHLFRIWKRLRMIVLDVSLRKPDIIITIDSSSFSFALARRLKKYKIPLVHLNAPKVWAYRPGRVKTVAKLYDHLLALLPFEPSWFEAAGLKCTFIGHPVIEYGADKGNGSAFRKKYGIPSETPILCVLPGSRSSEINALLPIFEKVVCSVCAQRPDIRLLMPTVSNVARKVKETVSTWKNKPLIIENVSEKFDSFAASTVALVASGTVSVEMAIAKTPMVVAYKVSPITAAIIRKLVTVRYASIVNLLLNRPIIPEFIQENCTAEKLTAAVLSLIEDPQLRATQIAEFNDAAKMLGQGDRLPSERAAEAIWETLIDLKKLNLNTLSNRVL